MRWLPYDLALVAHSSDLAVPDPAHSGPEAAESRPPRHRHSASKREAGRRTTASPSIRPPGSWLTVLAFVIVAVPFAWAIVALLTSSDHLTLPDDLALIDLHTRRALGWHQQLGVFDHNNWNHPGPAYFYLQSFAYRLFGSSPRALFVGAALWNGLAAVACVAVVRRRTTPTRAVWTSLWVCALAMVLAIGGTAATTYSESVLGALVSPWNPMVVLFPLLLLVLLCASALDRSGPSLAGAVLVATYVAQADISVGPLAFTLVGAAGLCWLITLVADRRGAGREEEVATGVTVSATAADPFEASGHWHATTGMWRRVIVAAALGGTVLAWVPPLVEQVTNHPGNVTLIVQFFNAGHPGQPLHAALWAFASGASVLVLGPAEVMGSLLGNPPAHAGVAVAVSLATVVVATAAAFAGLRARARFAGGLGVLVLVGCLASVVALTHVIGFIFGYLAIWVVVLPTAACIAIGLVPLPEAVARRFAGTARAITVSRIVLSALGVGAGVALMIHVLAIPPLSRASDPHVGQLADLVEPYLLSGGRVAVGDAGAGTAETQLLDTEEFIGLVNQLERDGYQPTVNAFWKSQFGPGYLSDTTEPRVISLSTWTPRSHDLRGYVGQVGDMAVTVTTDSGAPVTRSS